MERKSNLPLNVLLIDDNRLFAEVVGMGLTNYGYASQTLAGVCRFFNGFLDGIGHNGNSKAINLLESDFFVAFVDSNLGNDSMSGLQIIPHLRKHEIPCLGISANPDEEARFRQVGCFGAVLKGIIDRVLPGLQSIVENNRDGGKWWDWRTLEN